MEMIILTGLALLALLAWQQRKGSTQHLRRVPVRRNMKSTDRQTDVPEDRC
jgi:hypothetical protein